MYITCLASNPTIPASSRKQKSWDAITAGFEAITSGDAFKYMIVLFFNYM